MNAMQRRWARLLATAALAASGTVSALPLQAAMPVIDAAAIEQLVQQIAYWEQQIEAMANQLTQLEATHEALNGPRGMEALLPQTYEQRNYLPPDWAEVEGILQGQSAHYGALAAQTTAAVEQHAVLDEETLARMTEHERASVIEARQAANGMQVVMRTAYTAAAERFGALAELVTAIGTATDTKSILDLQGRIQAEQAMLANEQAKLRTLADTAQAERWAREQRDRELALAGHGHFDTRLRPVPTP